MKIRKSVTSKVLRANRENSQKSTGPKTQSGKQRVKYNAMLHGFYSGQLRIAAEDQHAFETLRTNLLAELAPGSPLQEIACERVVTCAWRCKLAVRLESRRTADCLHETNPAAELPPGGAPTNIPKNRWEDDRKALGEALRFLAELRKDVAANMLFHADQWKEAVVKTFGPEFWETLTEWTPSASADDILMADMLGYKHENWGIELPWILHAPDGVLVVSDSRLQWNMLVKVIDLKTQELNSARRRDEQSAQMPGAEPVEFLPRHFASANRELEKAVDWLPNLRANKM